MFYSKFIEHCAACFQELSTLCMMSNEAAPSYFNGATVPEYIDYRLYVISHFPKLKILDDTVVSDKERYAVGFRNLMIYHNTI